MSKGGERLESLEGQNHLFGVAQRTRARIYTSSDRDTLQGSNATAIPDIPIAMTNYGDIKKKLSL